MLEDRVFPALVIGALLLGVLFWTPPWVAVALLTAIVLAGAWEWTAFARLGGAGRIVFVAVIALLLPASWFVAQQPAGERVILGVALVWWIVALARVGRGATPVSRPFALVAGVLALVPMWLAIATLRLDFARGADWILFTLLLVVAADTGAFFAGRAFGRVRLAPQVSPGKTWEGAFGGLAAGLVIAAIGATLLGLPLVPMLALCAAVIAFSIVGDLTESLFKRAAGLKDSGSLLRGHGGVLDRLDSLTAAAPVFLAGLRAMGVTA